MRAILREAIDAGPAQTRKSALQALVEEARSEARRAFLVEFKRDRRR